METTPIPRLQFLFSLCQKSSILFFAKVPERTKFFIWSIHECNRLRSAQQAAATLPCIALREDELLGGDHGTGGAPQPLMAWCREKSWVRRASNGFGTQM